MGGLVATSGVVGDGCFFRKHRGMVLRFFVNLGERSCEVIVLDNILVVAPFGFAQLRGTSVSRRTFGGMNFSRHWGWGLITF